MMMMINFLNLIWRAECCSTLQYTCRERQENFDQHYDRSQSEDQDYAFLLRIDTMP